MTRRGRWTVAFVLLPAAVALAQGPPCPEFRVHTQTLYDQERSAVSSDASGNFVVVWESDHAEVHPDVFAQRYDASGTRQGSEFRVNSYVSHDQIRPSVASAPSGGFVVAWMSFGQDGSFNGVFGQRFDAAGVPRGPEFQVNTYTTNGQGDPAVGVDGSGRFVVVWISLGQEDPSSNEFNIFGQRFDASGNKAGPEFRVNTYVTGSQTYPRIAVAASGDFIVVWSSYQNEPNLSIYAQRYDSAGVPQGSEFRVNTYTTSFQSKPSVAYDANGNFVVVWQSFAQDGSGYGVFGQRFDASGAPQGPEFQVNSGTIGPQERPSIAADSAGGFVVVWHHTSGAYPADREVFGRRLSRQGMPLGADFRLNSYTTDWQHYPAVAGLPNGGFAAVWQSIGQDGSSAGIYGSVECGRLYAVTPCRLVDTRGPEGPTGGPPLAANASRVFPVAGSCGIPPDARAVAVNVTAVNPSDFGDLRLYPAGTLLPLASSVNFAAGRTRANNALVSLGTNGQVAVRCDMPPGSSGATHLVLDVYGYFKR